MSVHLKKTFRIFRDRTCKTFSVRQDETALPRFLPEPLPLLGRVAHAERLLVQTRVQTIHTRTFPRLELWGGWSGIVSSSNSSLARLIFIINVYYYLLLMFIIIINAYYYYYYLSLLLLLFSAIATWKPSSISLNRLLQRTTDVANPRPPRTTRPTTSSHHFRILISHSIEAFLKLSLLFSIFNS